MTTPLKKLQKEALLLELSPTEKAALHANLMRAMGASAPAATPARIASPYFFFTPQLMGSFAAVLLVVLLGGTAYAAQGTVPGDALYAIKTKVNEPIAGALAFSTEDKIKFHAEIAQVRLEEAEVLASQNRLDTAAAQTIESSIEAHLSQRAVLALALEEEKPDASSASATRFNSSIAAHSDVLAQLGAESSSSTTKQNSDALASKVRVAYAGNSARNTRAFSYASAKATAADMVEPEAPQPMMMSVSLADDMLEATATLNTQASSVPPTEIEAEARQQSNVSAKEQKQILSLGKRATSTLLALERSVKSLESKVDAETTAKLTARLNKISSLIIEGEAALVVGDYELAESSFDEALDRSTTLSTFIKAQERYNKGILKNLLGNDSRWGHDE